LQIRLRPVIKDFFYSRDSFWSATISLDSVCALALGSRLDMRPLKVFREIALRALLEGLRGCPMENRSRSHRFGERIPDDFPARCFRHIQRTRIVLVCSNLRFATRVLSARVFVPKGYAPKKTASKNVTLDRFKNEVLSHGFSPGRMKETSLKSIHRRRMCQRLGNVAASGETWCKLYARAGIEIEDQRSRALDCKHPSIILRQNSLGRACL
jgi:hypothetical protein